MNYGSNPCHCYHFSHSECVAKFQIYALHCHLIQLEITCHDDIFLQLKVYPASNVGLWYSRKGVNQEFVF